MTHVWPTLNVLHLGMDGTFWINLCRIDDSFLHFKRDESKHPRSQLPRRPIWLQSMSTQGSEWPYMQVTLILTLTKITFYVMGLWRLNTEADMQRAAWQNIFQVMAASQFCWGMACMCLSIYTNELNVDNWVFAWWELCPTQYASSIRKVINVCRDDCEALSFSDKNNTGINKW